MDGPNIPTAMSVLDNKLQYLRRRGIAVEYGSSQDSGGDVLFWVSAGNISAEGFRTLGNALNAIRKELESPSHLSSAAQKVVIHPGSPACKRAPSDYSKSGHLRNAW